MPTATGRKIVYKRPPLKEYQLKAIFHDARYGIIEASPKSGKTHGCLAWLAEQAFLTGKPGRHYWWVAPVYPQAAIAFRRMRDAIPESLRKPNESDMSLTLPNGATIWFKSGEKPDNLYGEDVYAAVVDESTRCREEAWFALRTTLTATQGPVRIIGNWKGKKNWAYKLARKAESGEQGMHYAKIVAQDAVNAGILVASEIEDAKRQLPERVFNELFLGIPSDDGGNPFGLDHIAACVKPPSTMPPAAFGIDLAKSVDWTVAIGLDQSGNVAAFDRFQMPWKETIARIKGLTNGCRALVDSTGVGDPVVEELQRGSGSWAFEGYKFTQESKQKLMEGLAVGIQQGKVGFPDGPIRMELESFEYEYTRTGVRYTAPESMHDDCVVALALAYSFISTRAVRPQSAMSFGNTTTSEPTRADWMR